ncbi:uncharacterized protein [Dysidea avara]|uniref:uncharacterized protein n=1 Tax=Dysidea avara TaxID=196820 RepID=UPI003316EE5F
MLPERLNDPILWQMIVERLYTMTPDTQVPMFNVDDDDERILSDVEENAIFYVAGYVIRKLIYKHQRNSSENSKVFVSALWDMLGEDCNSITAIASYCEYVKIWLKNNDRGGLKHVSIDTYNCFKAIELVSYKLLIKGHTKNETTLQTLNDPNVIFHWEFISDIADEVTSLALLKEVIDLWFTIRGFSVANRLFEDYKIASKANIKGKKGIRKTLQ